MKKTKTYFTTSQPEGKQAPSAKGLPLIGHGIMAAKDPLKLLCSLAQHYDGIVKVRLGLKDFYVLQSPTAAKQVLQDNAQNYYKPGTAKLMKKILGNGLATSNGNLWLTQRKLMQPVFHRSRIEGFFGILEEEVSLLIEQWKNQPAHLPVNISKAFLHLTLNNLTRSLFGTDVDKQIENIEQVLGAMLDFSSRNVKSLIKIPLAIPTPENLRFRKAEKDFENIIYQFIARRRDVLLQNEQAEYNDLLQLLLTTPETGKQNQLSAKHLKDEITTLFMTGHETTAQTLSWIFYWLAADLTLYNKVKEEVDQLGPSGLKPDDLKNLFYTRSLIEEALRFYPPVWIIARRSIDADCIDGYYLPKRSTILINVYGMHHHPAHWQAPKLFNPDRFALQAKESRPPFLYLPFGGGQRLCIGQHFAMMVMQTVIIKLVREFSFTIHEGFIPEVDTNITLRAKKGIQLHIHQSPAYANLHSVNGEFC